MSRGIPRYVGQFYKYQPMSIVLTEEDAKEGMKLYKANHFMGLIPPNADVAKLGYNAMSITDVAINKMRTTTT